MLFAPLLFRSIRAAKSENRSVAVDRKRRVPGAQLRGELAPGRPGAAFEDARQRQRGSGETRADAWRQLVDQSHRQRPPLDDELVADFPLSLAILRLDEVQHAGVQQQSAVAVLGQSGELVA